ncbi:MAG TPA: O-antigen ligase family protein [Sphingomicrobium sp.]|nr:O-antigen ligase family protein [Sphingomicrobium sp.]
MHSRARQAVAPVYLFACLILGGSAQGIWQNMVLQLAGVAIIGWAAASSPAGGVAAPARHLLMIAALAIAVVGVELIPLPISLWAELGARKALAQQYGTLGIHPSALPLSLNPYGSLDSLLGVIPPLAMVCAMVRLKTYRPAWLAIALLAGTVAGILLGALQVASSHATEPPWYLYEETNIGTAVGFFANVNHMATLLVISLPFLAAIAATSRTGNVQRYSAVIALTAGGALLIVVGLALNGSLAGYGLALPVLAASALIVLRPNSRLRIWAVVTAALLLVGAVTALETTSIGGSRIGEDATTSVQSREAILSTTAEALKDFFPFGSGLGSFRSVYHLYEKPTEVTDTYVIHAHNDYVELALETGVAGLIVLALFLVWWAAAVWRVWRTAEAGPFARAASIASAAVLVHSLVDFPLRTAAISACFGMCAAFLGDRRAPRAAEASDLRPTRHVVMR